MAKISVIVPVYRVEKYLPVCLDSLRSQTLKDIEIICVDDGSPDRSRRILETYAALDERISIISKENGGLSSARNAGIRAATSEFICFVDSDDILERNACEVIVGAFKTHECDVVTYGGSAFPFHRSSPWIDARLSPRDVVYDMFSSDVLFRENSHPYAWRTALKRDFVIENGLFFDEDLRFGEDELFHFMVYPRSKKTALISNRLYRYRVDRQGSLMATRAVDPILKTYDHLRIVERICRDWHHLGLIELYYKDLLNYIADFVLRDVLEAHSQGRMVLLRFARSIFEAYFTDAQLGYICADRVYGGIARSVVRDPSYAWRLKRKAVLYAFTLKTDPLQFVRAGWRRFWSIPLLSAVKQKVFSKLPLSSREHRYLIAEFNAEIAELKDLSDSKTVLDFELNDSCRA